MDTALYDELYRVEETHWWFQARRHIVWSLVERHARSERQGSKSELQVPRLRVCELGCGTGGNLAAVADRHDVVGVECSPQALIYARRRLGDRVVRGSLPDDVPLAEGSFDVVLLTDVLEHVEDDAASARAALRLLRPDGIVVATVPAYQWLYSSRDAAHHHFRRYSNSRFRGLWRGANVKLLSHYNTLLFPAAAAARVAGKFRSRSAHEGDLAIPPRLINAALAGVMKCEINLLGRLAMPYGLSLVAVVEKRSSVMMRSRPVAA